MNFLKTIKGSVFIAVIVGIWIVAGSILMIVKSKFQDSLALKTSSELELFNSSFKNRIKARAKVTGLAIEVLLNDKQVVEAFARRDRKFLVSYLTPFFKKRLKPAYGIKQFQFHTPPAISFFRAHKPQKFNDDLSSFRKTVLSVNKNKKPIKGIEVGRGGPGIRVVYPVFYDKKHIGSVEFGVSITKILNYVAKSMNTQYAIGIKQAVFQKARRFKNKPTDIVKNNLVFYSFSDTTIKGIIQNDSIKNNETTKHKVGDHTFVLTAFPIKDYSKQIIGQIVVKKDITKDIKIFNSQISFLQLIVIVLSIVVAIIVFLFLQVALKPLDEFRETISDLNEGDGDLTKRIEIKKEDEFAPIAKELSRPQVLLHRPRPRLDDGAHGRDGGHQRLPTVHKRPLQAHHPLPQAHGRGPERAPIRRGAVPRCPHGLSCDAGGQGLDLYPRGRHQHPPAPRDDRHLPGHHVPRWLQADVLHR